MDNVKYKPGGGDKKIFDDKDYLKQKSSSLEHSLSGSQVSCVHKSAENVLKFSFILIRYFNHSPKYNEVLTNKCLL